jgi:multicomponent Na+:H+ antiporter subunit E
MFKPPSIQKNTQKLKQGLSHLKKVASQTPNVVAEKAKQTLNFAKKIYINKGFRRRIGDLKPLTAQQIIAAKQRAQELLDREHPAQFRIGIASIGLFIIWLFLISHQLSFGGVIAGMIAAVLTAWLSSNHLTFIDYVKFSSAMPVHIALYLKVFFIALIKANIDMVRRILSPDLLMNSVMVQVKTELKSPLGKLLLANSMTLSAGTLTVDVLDDTLQIHWIADSQNADLVGTIEAISESFERHLREIIK